MTKKVKRINPDELAPPTGYTHVVTVKGRLAFISGQVAYDKAGKLVGDGDVAAQTRQVFENLKAALAELGVDFKSVVKVNYYAIDETGLQEIRKVRSEYLGDKPPASTFVFVKGLVRPELLIEVEAIVALPD
jgi:enamine deaminase RidA (YjgF/YER057c/UK114 family)